MCLHSLKIKRIRMFRVSATLSFCLWFINLMPAQAQFPDLRKEAKKIENQAKEILNKHTGAPSTADVANGLKEALKNGANKGSVQASSVNGYFKNPLLKIPFPPEVQQVETKLRQIGLGSEIDKFVLALNRGAEEAAKSASPIFVTAITNITIADAWSILRGNKDAATQYLTKQTSSSLYTAFKPTVIKALQTTAATKYYANLINTYNKVPGVNKVNPDLGDYATKKAISGLFILIAKEEAEIRQNPAARTTELLKKVFAEKNQKR